MTATKGSDHRSAAPRAADYAFFSPSTFTTITVRVLARSTPPATYVPAGLRESLLEAPGKPRGGNGVGTALASSA